ncbi:hypothetical protein Tco_0392776 [Tanacetum coccineum]
MAHEEKDPTVLKLRCFMAAYDDVLLLLHREKHHGTAGIAVLLVCDSGYKIMESQNGMLYGMRILGKQFDLQILGTCYLDVISICAFDENVMSNLKQQEKICRVFIEKQVTVTGLIVMLMCVLKVKNGTEAGITGSDAAVKSLE